MLKVAITVPASVANLGSGLDIFGLALELENQVIATERKGREILMNAGEGASPELRDPARNLVCLGYIRACQELGVEVKGVEFQCSNLIPMGKGLGSSSAALAAGVLAGVGLAKVELDINWVIRLVGEMEGHRDNVAACLLGGLAICVPGTVAKRMNVPRDIKAILYLPETGLSTKKSRGIIPGQYSREQAIFNAARCALLVRGMALSDYQSLGTAMEDSWHQGARSQLMPFTERLMGAAREAGAVGACLAGAGPGVLALAAKNPTTTRVVKRAMEKVSEEMLIPGYCLTLELRNAGAGMELLE